MRCYFIYVCIILASICGLSAQHIANKKPNKSSENDKRYALLSSKVQTYIAQDMYGIAIDCLEKMFSITCSNADRQKDCYSLVYCYFQMEDYQQVLEACDKYISFQKSSNDKNLKQIFFFQGFSYFELNAPKQALVSFEKAISCSRPNDYQSLQQNHHFAGKCYYLLGNYILAEKNFKKSIAYRIALCGIGVNDILNYGKSDFGLGLIFYDYSLVKRGRSYQDWLYLLLLSAKCGNPKAVAEAEEYDLLNWTNPPRPSANLFSVE